MKTEKHLGQSTTKSDVVANKGTKQNKPKSQKYLTKLQVKFLN